MDFSSLIKKLTGKHWGVHPADHKRPAADQPVHAVPLPQRLHLMLSQHVGAAARPVVLVGLGGIWIEALKDVRLIPADMAEADIAVELNRLKAAVVLQGIRGAAAVDVPAIARVVAQVGAQMRANPNITEIDINPLVAYPLGSVVPVLALTASAVEGEHERALAVGMAEVLHAIVHTGNDSNKRKLLLGRGWAKENADGTLDTTQWDAFVNRMAQEGKLTQAHYDFAQGVWDLFESTKPLAQKTHRDVFGRYFAEVTANAFTDPFGVERRGGYAPAITDNSTPMT